MKHTMLKLLAFAAVIALSACGSSAKVIQSMDASSKAEVASHKLDVRQINSTAEDVPEHFLAAVKGHLKNELKKRGLLADTDGADHIDLNVTYYRMRSGFSRMMFGMLAGKDGIEADVSILRASDDSVLSSLKVSSYNIMAVGNEDDIARMFAEEAAEQIEKNMK